MRINKKDFRDSLTFIFVSIVLFMTTIDIVFPFVMFMLKALLYMVSFFMLVLGVGAMAKSFLGKKDGETLTES